MTFILAFSVGLGIGEHQRNFFRDSDWCYVYSPTGESIAVPLKSSPTMKRFADELLAVCKSKAKKKNGIFSILKNKLRCFVGKKVKLGVASFVDRVCRCKYF